MIYLTQARLMEESERTIHQRAGGIDDKSRRVCTQLLQNRPLFSLWRARHERSMESVAGTRRRDRQIATLRALSLRQIHRTALVRYLRENHVTGIEREWILAEFYGVQDAAESAIAEHRSYLVAASSSLCVSEVLELAGDDGGLELLHAYERAYSEYFRMFCDRVQAIRGRRLYLPGALIPEVRATAEDLRQRILAGDLYVTKISVVAHSRTVAASASAPVIAALR